jgi:hypothetical protein
MFITKTNSILVVFHNKLPNICSKMVKITKNCDPTIGPRPLRNERYEQKMCWSQGNQIGRIFAYRAIVYFFYNFWNNTKVAHILEHFFHG